MTQTKSNPNQMREPASEPTLILRKGTLRDLNVAQLRQVVGGTTGASGNTV